MVKEDADVDRDRHGRIITDRDRMRGGRDGGGGRDRSAVGNGGGGGPVEYGATYGLSTRFLESLGIDCPLHTRVFVANLTYDVSSLLGLFHNDILSMEVTKLSFIQGVLKNNNRISFGT